MKVNKLSVNIDKTSYVLFKSKQKQISSKIPLSFDDNLLKQEQTVKFLGVFIDQNLSWKSHSNVYKTISKSIGTIYRTSFVLSTKLSYFYIIP